MLFLGESLPWSDEDAADLQKWLLNWGQSKADNKQEKENSDKLYKRDDYYPIVLF